jgi:hypothetical protein
MYDIKPLYIKKPNGMSLFIESNDKSFDKSWVKAFIPNFLIRRRYKKKARHCQKKARCYSPLKNCINENDITIDTIALGVNINELSKFDNGILFNQKKRLTFNPTFICTIPEDTVLDWINEIKNKKKNKKIKR